LPGRKKTLDPDVLKVISHAGDYVTLEDSSEKEPEVLAHGAAEDVDDVVVDDDDDEPDVQAHAGWGTGA
jgi:hypothetical protein